MAYFFTSDQHFGHHNILRHSKRPFTNVTEMDAALIRNWNKVVGPDDIVYHSFAITHSGPGTGHITDPGTYLGIATANLIG